MDRLRYVWYCLRIPVAVLVVVAAALLVASVL